MAFGSASKIFMAFLESCVENTAALDLDTDTIKVTNFGNSGTPDQTVSAANSAYNAGQWVSGNEVTATGWPAGGNALASIASGFASNVFTFDAADRAGGASDTITNAYGCEIYDDTLTTPVADQGVCFLAYGGANSVTSGTFTIVFNSSGILQITA